MAYVEAHNFTGDCTWGIEENVTESHVSEKIDIGGCLFRSVLPDAQAVPVMIFVFVLLTVLSIFNNVLTLFCLGHSDDPSWEPRFVLLKNLIVSDLMQTVAFGPTVTHSLIKRRTIAFGSWCYIHYVVGTASLFASLLTITCMALERYLYVCYAIQYLVILTQGRLRGALSLIWLYSVAVSVINLLLLSTGKAQSEHFTSGLLCEPDTMEKHMGFPRVVAVYRKITGTLTLFSCLLVYGFSYLRMYQDARNAVVPFNAVNTTARKTVLFYCSMLFLQLLPLLLKVIADALWEFEGTTAMVVASSSGPPSSRPSITAAVLHMSLLVMVLVPPCINPLVYGLKNASMRKALRSLFRWHRERN